MTGNQHASRTSPASVVVAVIMVTLAAVASGGVFGLQLQALVEETFRHKEDAAGAEAPKIKNGFAEAASIRALPPVITNLAGPQRVMVRIEASIVLAGEGEDEDDRLAAKIAEDMIAFLRTVSVAEIEGASGFQHLREDLNDRVRVRSDGRVRDLIVHTFVVE
jgi:flagellar FliL protein